MSEAVKEQIRRQAGNLKPGDVLVSNHPAAGGSHLPDITVITPVFKGSDYFLGGRPGTPRRHRGDLPRFHAPHLPPHRRRRGLYYLL
jgi:5-oxoprolinase (ATP-hydrolysing)